MAELFGICGADPERTRSLLDLMTAHVGSGRWRVVRHEEPGLGVVCLCHDGAAFAREPVAQIDGRWLAAMDGEILAPRPAPASHGPPGGALNLLRAFTEKGHAGLAGLCGSFCGAVYDRTERRLRLVTDRFCSRPLFYCSEGGALAFGTRFNALLAAGLPRSGQLDATALMQLITWQRVLFTSTLCAEVSAMPPASVLERDGERLALHRYWRLRYGGGPQSADECAETLADVLRNAARRAAADAARKGVLLSGGLDSRALAAATDAPFVAYTACDAPNRETRVAARVAHIKGWPHRLLVRSPDHYADALDEAVELSDGMSRFDHCQFVGLLDGVPAECDVLFNEDAMDALLKGYYWRTPARLHGIRLPVPALRRTAKGPLEERVLRMGAQTLYRTEPWRLLAEPWRRAYRERVAACVRDLARDADSDDVWHVAEHVGGLASLGRTLSTLRCVRTHAEFRALSLDNELLALAVSIPLRMRRPPYGGLAGALRRLDGRLYAVPYANTGLRPDAPAPAALASVVGSEALLWAKKRLGRLPPTFREESWPDRGEVLRTPRMREALERTLTDPGCLPPEAFDHARVRRMLDEHLARRRHHMRALLCLLTFGRWFARHGRRLSVPPAPG